LLDECAFVHIQKAYKEKHLPERIACLEEASKYFAEDL
jgi:hypothetical protein